VRQVHRDEQRGRDQVDVRGYAGLAKTASLRRLGAVR
jgi:hypothetical protein